MAKRGAPKKIESPEKLYEYFVQYKKWRDNNPRIEKAINHKEMVSFDVKRERPLTWAGFEIWLRQNDIVARLQDYKENKKGNYSEFSYILHDIGREIDEDKYSGAAVGIYNQSIIARDLGLADSKKVDHTNNGESFDLSNTINNFFEGHEETTDSTKGTNRQDD